MFCSKCGKEIEKGSSFCSGCGNQINEVSANNIQKQNDVNQSNVVQTHNHTHHNGMCCPNCGNRDLQVTNEVNVQTQGKNYSSGQGCLGYMLLGPLGLLCGSCGQSQNVSTTNTTYWVCNKCGNKFRNPDELESESKKMKTIGWVVLVIFFILYIIICIAFNKVDAPTIVSFIFLLIFIVPIVMLVKGYQDGDKAEQIRQGMAKYGCGQIHISNLSGYTQTESSTSSDKWMCPQCKENNPVSVRYCKCCGFKMPVSVAPQPIEPNDNEWKCPNCGKINQNYVGTCGCGTQKPR